MFALHHAGRLSFILRIARHKQVLEMSWRYAEFYKLVQFGFGALREWASLPRLETGLQLWISIVGQMSSRVHSKLQVGHFMLSRAKSS